jgi:hypothetical protein
MTASDSNVFSDLNPKTPAIGAEYVAFGVPIPKQKRIELFSSDDWEAFTEEWGLSLEHQYYSVKRHSSSGDKGLDVVGMHVSDQMADGYDNYQCKHYKAALAPSDIWVELAKVIFYTMRGDHPVPSSYYFVAPKGIGTKLLKLLGDSEKLKSGLKDNWSAYCAKNITNNEVELTEEIIEYIDHFDFSIFKSKSSAELIEGHSKTPFHSVRFGGGLPQRPSHVVPETQQIEETRYTEQLTEAYSDNSKTDVTRDNLGAFAKDYQIQRERFYSAEALKNFARDSVPPGTFDELLNEAFNAVYDTAVSDHPCGLNRMRAVLSQSTVATFSSSPLISRILEQDKKGMCHQLANENKLKWVP